MLRRGSTGPNVRAWQQFLIDQGHLPANSDDSIFGPQTELATKIYQTSEGFPSTQIDGIAGPLTLGAAHGGSFTGRAQEPDLVRRTAEGLGIDPDLMRAFVQVESGGRPGVRFEPHLAHRKLGERACCIPYTPKNDHQPWSVKRQETSRAAFDRALAHHPGDDEWAAAIIESSSFGLFQVLGSHLLDLFGVDAVSAYDADEIIVSHALLSRWFHRNPRALAAARKSPPDIEKLCRLYNGPANVPRYSGKLRAALAVIKARA